MFAEGSENAFPSNNAQGISELADRENSDQEVEEETRENFEGEAGDEESIGEHRHQTKFKRNWGGGNLIR
jgi:hypothetical protein